MQSPITPTADRSKNLFRRWSFLTLGVLALAVAALAALAPAGPAQAQATNVQAFPVVGGLVVSWSGSGNKVQWRSGNEAYSTTQRITPESEYVATGQANAYLITGLTPGTTYTVRVVNRATATTVDTPSTEVAGTAGSQQVLLTTDPEGGKLLVRWFPYSEASFYDVTAFSGQTQVFTDTFLDPAKTSYTIDTLPAGTYTVKVEARASNRNVISTAGISAEATGKVLLPPVTGLHVVPASATTLTASWNAVDGASNYEVQWRKDGQDWGVSDRTATTPMGDVSDTITVAALAAGVEKVNWYVRIRAKTTAGQGRWSYHEAEQGSLIPPTGLSASAPTSASVTLGWTAPTWTGKTLQHYFIDYWSGSFEDPNDKGSQTTTSTTANIQVLRPETEYTFRVYAKFDDDTLTRFSHPVTATTAAATAAPAQPASVTAKASSQWGISVSWAPDSASQGVTGYDLEFQTPQDGIWTPVPVFTKTIQNDSGQDEVVAVHDPPTSIQTIYGHNGLAKGSTYRYRVRAKNALGNSDWTESAWVTTWRNYKPIAFRYTFSNQLVPMYWHPLDVPPTDGDSGLPPCDERLPQAEKIAAHQAGECTLVPITIPPPPGQERPDGHWRTQKPFTLNMPGAYAPGPPGPHAYTPRAPGSDPVLLDDSEWDALYDYETFYPKAFLRYEEGEGDAPGRLRPRPDGFFETSHPVRVTHKATEKNDDEMAPEVSVTLTFFLTACSIAPPEGVTWPNSPYTPCPVGVASADSGPSQGPSAPDAAPTVSDTSQFKTHYATVGEKFSLVLPAADPGSGDGEPYEYFLWHQGAGKNFADQAINGLSFNPVTRTLSGTPEAEGTWELSYVVHDGDDNRNADADAFRERTKLKIVVVPDGGVVGEGETTSQQQQAPPNREPAFDAGIVTTLSVDENSPAGTNVGSPITATDTDEDDTLTYTLSGTDAASFEIGSSSGQITTKTGETYNYEAKSSYSLTVEVSDGNEGTDSIAVTVNLTNVNEVPAFSDDVETTLSVAENSAAGTGVGSAITATDLDGDTLTYSLLGFTGSETDAAAFEIGSASGQITTKSGVTYDGATKATYTFMVVATEKDTDEGLNNAIPITVTITEAEGGGGGDSEPPATPTPEPTPEPNRDPAFAVSSAALSVDENSAAGTKVGAAITATDPDENALTYYLTGTDASSFDIGSSTGQITTKTSVTYNYEAKSSYSLTVGVSDGNGGTDSVTVTVSLNDVNEAPTVANKTQFKNHAAKVGETFSLTLPAADANSGDGGPYKYLLWHRGAGKNFSDQAINGLSFDAATRTLSGTPAAAGVWKLSYVVHDKDDDRSVEDRFRARTNLQITVAS